MPATSRSIEESPAEIDLEVAAPPPGSDVAGCITRRPRELGALLAQRIAHGRQDASKEAAFHPPACPKCSHRAMRPVARPRPRTILLRQGELRIGWTVHEYPPFRHRLAMLGRALGVRPHKIEPPDGPSARAPPKAPAGTSPRNGFGITGARWKRQDLPHVLALRAAEFNGDWKLLRQTAA